MKRQFPNSLASIITFALLHFGTATIHAQDVKSHLAGDKTLPDVTVKDLSNKSVNISDYGKNGKITVLSFWATWCSPCKKELNNIAELYEDWQDEYDMELVAVSIDDSRNASKVKTYINGQQWDYDVLLDPNSSLKRALNFQTVPYTLLIDSKGSIVYTHSGYVEGDEYILEDHIKELE